MTAAAIDSEYDALRDDLVAYLVDGGGLAVVKVSRPGSTETFLFGIPALDEMGR